MMWSSDQCPDDIDEGSTTITDHDGYTIDALRGGTSYSITVTVVNMAGTSRDNITAQTLERGKQTFT